MKVLYFFILFTAISIQIMAQSTLPLRADTITLEKVGGNATLKIKNATRDSTGGVLTNIGGGVTAFKKSKKYNDTCIIIGSDTICGISRTVSANNGVYNNSNTLQLGDIAGQTDATLTVDRYLRSGNRSIYFQGNKTSLGVANAIFDDTLVAVAGDAKFKNWVQINSLNHVAPPYYFGTGNVEDGTGFINHTYNVGFNLRPNSTRANANYCAIGTSWEGNFQGLQEMHKIWIDKQDVQHRIQSFTIDTSAHTVDQYGQVSTWSLKDVDAGAESWVDFTGGQGSTSTFNRLYAGTTNQYRIQYGFSVNGGNTTGSISTTGPGSKEFHIGGSEGWGTVFLPSMFSNTAYNSFSAQVLPSADGTLRFGDPAAKWLTSNAYYHRSAYGMRIGDFSGDELPTQNYLQVFPIGATGGGVTIDGSNGGHASFRAAAKTSSDYLPFIHVIDYDNAGTIFAGMALERSPTPIMGGSVNDFLIYNFTSGKHILFGTNSGSGRVERMRLNATGELQIGSTTDQGAYTLQNTGGFYQSGSVTVNLGSDATGDIYYRNSGGSFTRLPIGTANQELRVNAGATAPEWFTSSSTTTLYSGDGSLAGNRTVTGGTNSLTFTSARTGVNATMNINNTSSGGGLAINASGSGTGIDAGSSTGYGGNIFSTSGPGLQVSSSSNTGLIINSTTGVPVEIQTTPASTNTTVPLVSVFRKTSGTAAANIAGAFDYYNENGAGNDVQSTRLISKLTTVTGAAEVSQFEIWGLNAGAIAKKFSIAGNGQLTLDGYGTGANTGTPAYDIQTTSAGAIIEKVAPKTYTALISQSGTSDPTAAVLGTNSVGAIVWTRNSAGNYTGTLTGAFTANKTHMKLTISDESGGAVLVGKLIRADANTVTLLTFNSSVVGADVFTNLSIEISVYP